MFSKVARPKISTQKLFVFLCMKTKIKNTIAFIITQNYQLRVLYSEKIRFKDEFKRFLRHSKLKEFIAYTPILKEILKY